MCSRSLTKISTPSSILGEWHIFGCACLKHKCIVFCKTSITYCKKLALVKHSSLTHLLSSRGPNTCLLGDSSGSSCLGFPPCRDLPSWPPSPACLPSPSSATSAWPNTTRSSNWRGTRLTTIPDRGIHVVSAGKNSAKPTQPNLFPRLISVIFRLKHFWWSSFLWWKADFILTK